MITAIKEPQLVSPSENPIVFQFSSNTNTLVWFDVQLNEATSNSIIYNGRLDLHPLNPSTSYIDLSRILSNLVKYDLSNANVFYTGFTRPVINYNITATEKVLTGTTLFRGDTYQSDNYKAWSAKLDILNFTDFDKNDYYLEAGNYIKFLSFKPTDSITNDYSFEQLYYLNNTGVTHNAVINVYSDLTYIPEVKAKATITFLDSFSIGDNAEFFIEEPPLGGEISMGFYTVTSADTDTTVLVQHIKEALSANTIFYGYSLISSGNTITVEAKNGIGSLMNGVNVALSTISGSTIIPTTDVYNQFIGGIDSTQGSILDSAGVSISNELPIIRLQTSPKSLSQTIGLNFQDAKYYTISLEDFSGNTISEVKRYKYQDSVDCNIEVVNIAWVNSLGGIDSYQFIQPQETLTSTKQTIKKNPFDINGSNFYSKNGVYNVSEEIYSSISKISFKCYTKELTDLEVFWLGEMVNSSQLFVEMNTGELIPVSLTSSNYNYQRQKYLKNELNQLSFEFELQSNVIPSINTHGVSYINNK